MSHGYNRCEENRRQHGNLRRAVQDKCDAHRPVEATGSRSSVGRGPVPCTAPPDVSGVVSGFSRTNMLPGRWIVLGLVIFAAQVNPARDVPAFRVDPSWPQIPANWQFGQVASVSVDADDHVWVLQRPGTLGADEKSKAAPPVIEFTAEGQGRSRLGRSRCRVTTGLRRSTASTSIPRASCGSAATARTTIRS